MEKKLTSGIRKTIGMSKATVQIVIKNWRLYYKYLFFLALNCGAGSVIACGPMAMNGTGKLHVIDQIMTKCVCSVILKTSFVPSIEKLGLANRYVI